MIAEACAAAGLPDSDLEGGFAELIRQQMAIENDFKNPAIIPDMAQSVKSNIDRFYSYRNNGASWLDVYAMAAGAYKYGYSAVINAISAAGSVSYSLWKTQIPGAVKYIGPTGGAVKSVIWDFNNWEWFDDHYRPIVAGRESNAVRAATAKKKNYLWAWILGLVGAAAIVGGKKIANRKER